MRFVIAVITLVVAALLVLLGLAQRTVFAPPDTVTSSVTTSSDARVTVIPSKVLKGYPGRETISISGGETAFAAYGRTVDIRGWVGKASYNTLSLDPDTQQLVSKTVTGSETKVPDPAGSDLWYEQYTGKSLDFSLDAPSDISVIVASDGKSPAPSKISITWPLSTATPLVGPLITAGLVVFLIGILFFIWAIAHHRRTRGPRRSSGSGTRPARRQSLRSQRKVTLGAGRRRGRRLIAVVPVIVAGSLVLGGCSAQYWPQGSSQSAVSTATPAPSAALPLAPGGDLQPPAVTVAQASRIITRITEVQNTADSTNNAALAATRFMGPALQQRQAAYTIRKAEPTTPAPIAIPSGKVTLTLPQQADSWPRAVFAVVQNEAQTSVVGVMLMQDDACDPYKVDYLVGLDAHVQRPTVAPATLGAARLAPDVKLLTMPPDQVAAAYADILRSGDGSKYASFFQKTGDTLRDKIGKPYKDAKAAALPDTASIDYSSETGSEPSIAFATNDAGAIVSLSVNEIETVKPTKPGAEVNTEGEVKSLSGVSSSTKGITATYNVQLLFSVPPVGSSKKIVLLGFSQALISAKEVP